MVNYNYLVNKLKDAIEKSGLTSRNLANKAGIHEVSLYRILNGQRKLNNLDTLLKLSKALEVDLDVFFEKESTNNKENFKVDNINVEVVYGDRNKPDNRYLDSITIPLMRSKVAATPSILEISTDHIEGWVTISTKNIPKNVSEKCFAFRVQGYSMEPMLQENDLVAIMPYSSPPSLGAIIPSNVYLVKFHDGYGGYGLSLKHINVINNEIIELVSDNKKYKSKTIHLDKDYFQIVGKVVWMWREF